ncbi:prepilin peptidase [Lentzea sp. JNUCC 0626]|uniref:prepilin peptidase n=1 Tax=Lentzea sp. JNUCC 0626 TaxID=3367513 RepID=UPI003748292D
MSILLSYGFLGAVAGPTAMIFGHSVARNEAAPWELPIGLGRWVLPVGVATAAVLCFVAARVPSFAAPVSWLLITGMVLASVDWTCHRLPHRVTGLLICGGVALLGLVGVGQLIRSVAALTVVFACGITVHLLSRRALGLGDVTLAAAVALFLGWFSWRHVAAGISVALLITAITTATLWAAHLTRAGCGVALGPGLIFGSVYVIVQF